MKNVPSNDNIRLLIPLQVLFSFAPQQNGQGTRRAAGSHVVYTVADHDERKPSLLEW